MRHTITLRSITTTTLPPWPAIVRGELALHTTPAYGSASLVRQSGRLVWTISHVATGTAIVRVVGAHDGRRALRALASLHFGELDARLLRAIGRVIKALDRQGVRWAYPGRPPKARYNPATLALLKIGTQDDL